MLFSWWDNKVNNSIYNFTLGTKSVVDILQAADFLHDIVICFTKFGTVNSNQFLTFPEIHDIIC